jgi:hypothetical protein
MANVRIFALILILLIIVNCAQVHGKNLDDTVSRDKRYEYQSIITYVFLIFEGLNSSVVLKVAKNVEGFLASHVVLV